MAFSSMPLDERLLRAVADLGWREPTTVQERAIPALLAGRDVLGRSQTGTGKTGAFGLPLLHRMLERGPGHRFRLLVIEPTRELAAQVHEHLTKLAAHTGLKGVIVTGGTGKAPEEHALRAGADWLVATPGRLIDHLQGDYVDVSALESLVLDEADSLMELGFLPSVRKIVSYIPERRITVLLSATLPGEMREIARQILREPVRVEIGEATSADLVRESLWPISSHQKPQFLRALMKARAIDSALVFVRTKVRAEKLAVRLNDAGPVAEVLHADRTMNERRDVLARFRSGKIPVLVATDLAARGLDISTVAHVVNYDAPVAPEDYIHRVGRTGRAGSFGDAYTFMSRGEEHLVAKIEHLIRKRLKPEKLAGFTYEEERDQSYREVRGRERGPTGLDERPASRDRKESPFTKSGKAKRGFEVPDHDAEMRKSRKKRIKMKKRLPHER